MDQPPAPPAPPLTLADLPEAERNKVQRIVDTTVRLGRENEALAAAAQRHDGVVAGLTAKLQKTAGLLYLYQSALEARWAATDEALDAAAAEHAHALAAARAAADAVRADNARLATALAEAQRDVAAQKQHGEAAAAELQQARGQLQAATDRCSRTEEACLGLTKQLAAVALKMRSMQVATSAPANHSEERRRNTTRHAATQCSFVEPTRPANKGTLSSSSSSSSSGRRSTTTDTACSPMRFSISKSPGDKENRVASPKRRHSPPTPTPTRTCPKGHSNAQLPATHANGRHLPTRAGEEGDNEEDRDAAVGMRQRRKQPDRQSAQQKQVQEPTMPPAPVPADAVARTTRTFTATAPPPAATAPARRARCHVPAAIGLRVSGEGPTTATVPRARPKAPPPLPPPPASKRRPVAAFDGDYDVHLFSLLDNL